MQRRTFILGLSVAAVARATKAQKPATLKRMAMVSPALPIEEMNANSGYAPYRAFFQELNRLGLVEGRNIIIDRYTGEGQTARYGDLAANVVRTRPDLIFATASPIAIQFKRATDEIPIVALTADPVSMGLAASLSRPGANVTGASIDAGLEIHGKRIQLLSEMLPNLSRIYYLASQTYWERAVGIAVRLAAKQAHVPMTELPLGPTVSLAAYQRTLELIESREQIAIIVSDEGEHLAFRRSLVDLVERYHIPASYPYREFVSAGGLMSYSVDLSDLFRLVAAQVLEIIKGKRPAEMPMHQPTRFEFAINAKTAKALGIELSPSFLSRADQVIE